MEGLALPFTVDIQTWISHLLWNKGSFPSSPHLKQPGDEDGETDGLHDVGVVLQKGLAAAFHPQVQDLRLVLVVEVGRVVVDVLLNAGTRWEGVAAAERNAVHQVPPLDVAPQPATNQEEQETETIGSFSLILWLHLNVQTLKHYSNYAYPVIT